MARFVKALSLLMLCCSSCLYLGTKNSAPGGAVVPEVSSDLLWQGSGSGIVLTAEVEDPDGDELSFSWWVKVNPEGGGEPCYLVRTNGPDNCSPEDQRVLSTKQLLQLTDFPLRGSYLVSLEVEDIYGARRELSYSFVVKNQAPALSSIGLFLLLAGGAVQPAGMDAPVHGHFEARLEGLSDRENDLRCGGSGHVTWELLYPGSEALEYWTVLPCQGNETQDGRLRLRLAVSAEPLPERLALKATVDDGQGETVSRQVEIALLPNRPPCLRQDGLMPPAGAMVPVLLEDPASSTFDVGPVDDDVQEGHHFSWLIRGAGETAFSLVPGANEPLFLLPAWLGEPGDQLELRAVVQDLYSPMPSCSAEEDFCASSASPGCYGWVTWQLELR